MYVTENSSLFTTGGPGINYEKVGSFLIQEYLIFGKAQISTTIANVLRV